MSLSFGNPAGFLALLAVPAILLIHFLQRESRQVLASTLFLLEQLGAVSAQGRRFDRLRHSLSLWLQILAALLIAWLLVEPRWLRRDSVQQVIVVLDSSVSLRAFLEPLRAELSRRLDALEAAAARTEWRLMETDPARETLYSGSDLGELRAAIAQWEPALGTHDFSPALRVAQNLARGKGVVLFVSDRAVPLPAGVALLSAGVPFDNCGFTGLRVAGGDWRVLLMNQGRAPQQRTWRMEAGSASTAPAAVTLNPGEPLELAGRIPTGMDRCELVLSPDLFTLDDRLPILRPQPKPIAIRAQTGTPFEAFFTQLIASVPTATAGAAAADVQLAQYDPLAPALPRGTAIVFVNEPVEPLKHPPGSVVAGNHPLTGELNWHGLLCKETLSVPAREGDVPLVWQGTRRLMFLRESADARLLVVNFDLRFSNAPRLPAFVLALHRFVESVRAAKAAPEKRNVETNQLVNAPGEPARRAPAEPGFFTAPLLEGAAHFADAREGNFRDAAPVDTLAGVTAALEERNSRADFLAPVWAVLLAVACLGNWAASAGVPR
jgi:hypothetical protein